MLKAKKLSMTSPAPDRDGRFTQTSMDLESTVCDLNNITVLTIDLAAANSA